MTVAPGEIDMDTAVAARMRSLLLTDPGSARTPRARDVVQWFGAMQAQDYASGLWSLGLRLPHLTRSGVVAAIEAGEIVRTWTQRGTIHLVAAEDTRWMLDLCGSRMLAQGRRRREQLGIPDRDAERTLDVLAEGLADGVARTKAELVDMLQAEGIDASGPNGYHLLWYASQRGVTCIGPHRDKQQTYVRLDLWAPNQRKMDREQALAELAVRYFRSHGPTTVKDFSGWSGLTMTDCRTGIGAAGARLGSVLVEGIEMLMAANGAGEEPPGPGPDAVGLIHLIAPYDEYLLGFKDRSAQVPTAFAHRIIPGNNGVFQPTVVRDGRVIGVWKRAERVRSIRLEVDLFDLPAPGVGWATEDGPAAGIGPAAGVEEGIRRAAQRYADFVGKAVSVEFVVSSSVGASD